MTMTIDQIQAACVQVNAAGLGRVSWQRVGTSSGSGRERTAGQFDGRAITKAQVSGNFLMFFLTQDAAGWDATGKPKATMRRIRLDTVRGLRPGV
jgi:hypothetical protein